MALKSICMIRKILFITLCLLFCVVYMHFHAPSPNRVTYVNTENLHHADQHVKNITRKGTSLQCSSFSIDQSSQDIEQDNLCLIEHIKHNIINRSEPNIHFHINDKNKHYSQAGQDEFVDELLRHRENGFFIECGAGDGVTLSNTLFFEKARGWTGLLIEADTESFDEIKANNRSAMLLNACVSMYNYPSTMVFQKSAMRYCGGLVQGLEAQHVEFLRDANLLDSQVQVQCFPLYSILLAANQTHVDYFSLDVEGPELQILQTIPWSKITIDVLTVEFRVLKPDNLSHAAAIDEEASERKFGKITQYMLGTGLYEVAGTVPRKGSPHIGLDVVFKRKVL